MTATNHSPFFDTDIRLCRHGNGDTGEVTGPPEASYLSNAAAFRLAQAAIRTEDRRQEVSTLSAVEDVPQPVFPPPVTYEASQWEAWSMDEAATGLRPSSPPPTSVKNLAESRLFS